MLRLSFETSLKPEEVIDQAEEYFMKVGLEVKEKGQCCLRLEGGGGYVNLDIYEKKRTEVELTGREWEYHIKKFAEKFS